MSDEEVVRLSVRVFEDDDPALFERLKQLPANKMRRRAHIVRLLRLGLAAELAGQEGQVTLVPSTGRSESKGARLTAASAQAPADLPAPEPSGEQIHMDDITALLGG